MAVVIHWQGQDIASANNLSERTESAVMAPLHQQHHEATQVDATQLYRICSSRPKRILSSQGSRRERMLTSTFNFVKKNVVKPLHSHCDSRCRLESAPFCLSASCDYYVIALRHIIR